MEEWGYLGLGGVREHVRASDVVSLSATIRDCHALFAFTIMDDRLIFFAEQLLLTSSELLCNALLPGCYLSFAK